MIEENEDIYQINIKNGDCIGQLPLIYGIEEAEKVYQKLANLGYKAEEIICTNLTKEFKLRYIRLNKISFK